MIEIRMLASMKAGDGETESVCERERERERERGREIDRERQKWREGIKREKKKRGGLPLLCNHLYNFLGRSQFYHIQHILLHTHTHTHRHTHTQINTHTHGRTHTHKQSCTHILPYLKAGVVDTHCRSESKIYQKVHSLSKTHKSLIFVRPVCVWVCVG